MNQGVVVMGVAQGGLQGGDTDAILQQFVAQTGISFSIGKDSFRTYNQFRAGSGISPFPLDVIIDRDGKIAYIKREYDADAMIRTIETLLSQQ